MLFVNKYTYKLSPKYFPLNDNIVFEKKNNFNFDNIFFYL